VTLLVVGWMLSAPTTRASPGVQATSGFELTVTPVGNASATLRWTALPDAASYTVYGAWTALDPQWAAELGQPAGLPGTNPLTLTTPGTWVAVVQDLGDTSVTVADLAPSQTYSFLVRAVDPSGQEYAQSGATSVALATAPGTHLEVKMPTLTTARLAWLPVAGAARYLLFAAPVGRPLAPDRARAAMTTTATVIDGLPPGSTWRFTVVAQDGDGHMLARTQVEEVTTTPAMSPLLSPGAGGPPGPAAVGGRFPPAPWLQAPGPARFWRPY
jgi:hypothetical protein